MLPADAAERVAALASRLARAAHAAKNDAYRAARTEQLHYTLKFLGAVDEDGQARSCEVGSRIAAAYAPFALTLAGVGAFPKAARPRVVWVGARDGAAKLTALAQGLDAALVTAGFVAEERPFAPHLTIARMKGTSGQADVAAAIEKYAAADVGTMHVTEFSLMQSKVTSAGATYTPVATFPLAAGDGNDQG